MLNAFSHRINQDLNIICKARWGESKWGLLSFSLFQLRRLRVKFCRVLCFFRSAEFPNLITDYDIATRTLALAHKWKAFIESRGCALISVNMFIDSEAKLKGIRFVRLDFLSIIGGKKNFLRFFASPIFLLLLARAQIDEYFMLFSAFQNDKLLSPAFVQEFHPKSPHVIAALINNSRPPSRVPWWGRVWPKKQKKRRQGEIVHSDWQWSNKLWRRQTILKTFITHGRKLIKGTEKLLESGEGGAGKQEDTS